MLMATSKYLNDFFLSLCDKDITESRKKSFDKIACFGVDTCDFKATLWKNNAIFELHIYDRFKSCRCTREPNYIRSIIITNDNGKSKLVEIRTDKKLSLKDFNIF